MTIKLKIQVFALIAVLAPFVALGYFAYSHSLRINQARFGQELHSLGALAAAAADRHIGRLVADIVAFAAVPLLQQAVKGNDAALPQVHAYFVSLRSRFPDFRQLWLADTEGWPVDSEGPDKSRRSTRGSGIALLMDEEEEPLLRVTVGVMNGTDAMSGYLVADIGLEVLRPSLDTTMGKSLYLVSNETRVLDSSGAVSLSTPITTDAGEHIFGFENVMHYRDHRGIPALGLIAATRVDGLGVLAEMDAEYAFVELKRLKTRILWILAAVLGVLMIAAHLFGASLVRPLNALVDGARRVADGDLDIDLPASRSDEIGYLSRVFNDMVERLQDSRHTVQAAQSRLLDQNRRLEELTVTDTLTGLANRRSLVEHLTRHLERYQRNGRPFSVLMLDLDNFKSVNDRHGHLAGDEVLRRFSASLVGTIRSVDFAARYGGEEFTIILFETGSSDALDLAERIRYQVEHMRVEIKPGLALTVTASIGIAEICDADAKPDDLLQRADAALYQAKQAGRNRVYLAADS